jgi:hypothetical protein
MFFTEYRIIVYMKLYCMCCKALYRTYRYSFTLISLCQIHTYLKSNKDVVAAYIYYYIVRYSILAQV